ncbi:hypothetical protein QVD17_19948 [Tagetes erecta]|uniref:Uncharacterized protein n=1 Tax=Tagetes erecta TaxID=13708 RepID=A0AAD8KRV7_TARER|nr:hypothetical protein QVD17_19948 [Tagetes erecta]
MVTVASNDFARKIKIIDGKPIPSSLKKSDSTTVNTSTEGLDAMMNPKVSFVQDPSKSANNDKPMNVGNGSYAGTLKSESIKQEAKFMFMENPEIQPGVDMKD